MGSAESTASERGREVQTRPSQSSAVRDEVEVSGESTKTDEEKGEQDAPAVNDTELPAAASQPVAYDGAVPAEVKSAYG